MYFVNHLLEGIVDKIFHCCESIFKGFKELHLNLCKRT